MSINLMLNILRKHELFRNLDELTLRAILEKMEIHSEEANALIFSEGDIGLTFYCLVEGRVSIFIEDKQGQIIELTQIQEGSFFGEMALLTDSKRTASVKAITNCKLMCLTQDSFHKLMSDYPIISTNLNRILSQRLKVTNELLRQQKISRTQAEHIRKNPEDMLELFRDHMEPCILPKDSIIFKEGEPGDSFFLIEEGEVEVYVLDHKTGQQLSLAVLKVGDYFGEMAVLTDSFRTASAKAISPCKLRKISKETFNNMLLEHHQIAIDLSKILSKRLSSMDRVISHKSNNIVLLIIGADTHPVVKRIQSYLDEITTKPRHYFPSANMSELQVKIDTTHESVIIAINASPSSKMLALANHIINLKEPLVGQVYLSQSCSKEELERSMRKILGKSIGIALSSGTAPGLAHLGVMKVLLENNIPIDFIAGTSGGSLYGSPFAFGKSFSETYAIFEKIYKKSIYQLFDLAMSHSGLFAGNKLIRRSVLKLIGSKNIEDSLIPFAAVASDLYTGQETIITEGSVAKAVRASLSIPILFKPVRHGDQLLVDGVVTTPVPISALEKADIDIKIAVYVMELSEFSPKSPNLLSVFLRSRNISSDFIAEESVERADVVIKPDLTSFKQFEYKAIDRIIKVGEDQAKLALPRIKRLLNE